MDVLALLAEVGRVPVDRVIPTARLGDIGLGSSLTVGVLKSRMKRQWGVELGVVDWRTTVAHIQSLVTSLPVTVPAALVAGARSVVAAEPRRAGAPAPMLPSIAIGLDMQDLASLPAALEDPFFPDHFTAAELAAAASRTDWREHLCGVWCAKEAVKKAVPALLGAPFTMIEVRHNAAGAPTLLAAGLIGAVSLSITHTASAAAAVVVVSS